MEEQHWVVVADSAFLPARGGGEREHLGFIRAARAAGWLAAVVVPTTEPLDAATYAAELGDAALVVTKRRTGPLMLLHPRYPYVVASRPAPADLAARVRAVTAKVTGVVTFSYKSRLIGQALAADLDVPMVLRQHNREGDYHRALAAGLRGPRRLVMAWEATRIARDEARVDSAAGVTAIADISLADAAARRAAGGRNVIHVPPFAYDSALAQRPMHQATAAGGVRVLFLGALDVPTNQTALRWFLDGVWPVVLRQAPHAELDVVGRNPSVQLRSRLASARNVTLHADVPSVTTFLDRATIAVNPAVTGSGVNIKVIDYLQAGVPLVSTSLATAGLALRAGVDLEVADTPDAFAELVLALLGDGARRDRLACQGRDHIEVMLEPRKNLARIADAFAGRG